VTAGQSCRRNVLSGPCRPRELVEKEWVDRAAASAAAPNAEALKMALKVIALMEKGML
jgi:hypothetical protein